MSTNISLAISGSLARLRLYVFISILFETFVYINFVEFGGKENVVTRILPEVQLFYFSQLRSLFLVYSQLVHLKRPEPHRAQLS